jgi:hypothetical protein
VLFRSLSEAYRLSINEHNIKVKKNREILSKIIDCIFFCGNFETPLRGHDEKDDSVNPGVFRGLVNFASKLDSDLKNHLKTSCGARYCHRSPYAPPLSSFYIMSDMFVWPASHWTLMKQLVLFRTVEPGTPVRTAVTCGQQ